MTRGDLVLIKWFHLKQKRVISVPGIFLYSHIYIDDPTQTSYFILIIEPESGLPTTTEITKKPVSCL